MFGGNLKEQGDLFASEHLIPGLGDVGAHVSQIMDGGWASFILSHYVREKGVFTLKKGGSTLLNRYTNRAHCLVAFVFSHELTSRYDSKDKTD